MSEKYLQEIEEILKEAEVAPPPEKDESAPPPRTSGRYVLRPPRLGRGRPLPYLSAGKVGLAAMGILLLALVVGGAFGPEWLFVGFVIGLLVVAYLMFFARPSGPNSGEAMARQTNRGRAGRSMEQVQSLDEALGNRRYRP